LFRSSRVSVPDVSPWFYLLPKSSGDQKPYGVERKKIGFLRWVQTVAIWMRGMLIDEHGVSAANSAWYVAAMHHWDDADPGAVVEPRDGSVIRWMSREGKNTFERASRAIFDGEIDALGVTETQLGALLGAIRSEGYLKTL